MRKALSPNNFPRRVSVTGYLVAWLLLDRFQPPGWAWGVALTFCGLCLIAQLVDFYTAKDVEIFSDEDLKSN